MTGRTPDQDALALRYERGELSHGEFRAHAIASGMDRDDVDAVQRGEWMTPSELVGGAA